MKKTSIFLKEHWAWIVGFAFIYACLVVISTILNPIPAAIELEQGLYDRIQKQQAINSKGDANYPLYKDALEELTFINFDEAVIDTETDRLKPAALAAFLRKIQPYQSQLKVLFIDYAVRDLSLEDSIELVTTMQPFEKRLLLPYTFEIEGDIQLKGSKSRINTGQLKNVTYPIYSGGEVGYVTSLKSTISDDYRLYKYRIDDGEHYSVPYKLYELSRDKQTVEKHIKALDNRIVEINFLLRNKEAEGQEKAVLTYHLSDFTNGIIPSDKIKELLENKIVCVGLFGAYTNKYGQNPDKFVTPIDNEMSGALLLINAYLNLATNSYLQQANYLWLFLINLILGSIVGFYYRKREKGELNLLKGTLTLLVINFVLPCILLCLLDFMIARSVYLSLGMTLFFMLQGVIIYLLYSEIMKAWTENNKKTCKYLSKIKRHFF